MTKKFNFELNIECEESVYAFLDRLADTNALNNVVKTYIEKLTQGFAFYNLDSIVSFVEENSKSVAPSNIQKEIEPNNSDKTLESKIDELINLVKLGGVNLSGISSLSGVSTEVKPVEVKSVEIEPIGVESVGVLEEVIIPIIKKKKPKKSGFAMSPEDIKRANRELSGGGGE